VSGGVVVGEGGIELAEGGAGGRGEIGKGGDLAGEAAQGCGVVASPGGVGAVGGAAFAGGLDALFAGGSGGAGATPQIAAFGGLAAADTEGVGEVRPAGACLAGSFDQAGLPSGELLAHLPQQQKGRQSLLRAGVCASGVGGLAVGVVHGVVDGFQGRRRGQERGRALGVGTGGGGWPAAVTGTPPRLSSLR
jgi:hypothetical protein